MASKPSREACSTDGKERSLGFRLNLTMAEQVRLSFVRCS
jgi:hypothetical protein